MFAGLTSHADLWMRLSSEHLKAIQADPRKLFVQPYRHLAPMPSFVPPCLQAESAFFVEAQNSAHYPAEAFAAFVAAFAAESVETFAEALEAFAAASAETFAVAFAALEEFAAAYAASLAASVGAFDTAEKIAAYQTDMD